MTIKLKPSAACQWSKCPASVQMQLRYPDTSDKEAAKLGRKAHEAAASILERRSKSFDTEDEEYKNAVEEYVAEIQSNADNSSYAAVEYKVNCDFIIDGMIGVVDYFKVDKSNRVLDVYDFKCGRAEIEAKENEQLMTYTLALIRQFKLNDLETIRLHIIQPRCYGSHHKIWELTKQELFIKIVRIREAAINAISEVPLACTGSQCHFCSAKHACRALKNDAVTIAENVHELTEEISNEQLNGELIYLTKAAKILDDRITAMSVLAKHRIENGEQLENYILEPSYHHAAWDIGLEELVKICKEREIDILKEREPITPAKAKKSYKQIKDLVDKYSKRHKKGVNLKQVDVMEVFKR